MKLFEDIEGTYESVVPKDPSVQGGALIKRGNRLSTNR